MVLRRNAKKISSGRRKRYEPNLCDHYWFFAIDLEFNLKTLKLTGIDLFDPDAKNEDDVWITVAPPYTQEAQKAATKALKKFAVDGERVTECQDKGCECDLSESNWSAWGPWNNVEIYGRFSIAAPNPPPPKLRYRAKGTIDVKTRMKIGYCYQVKL